MCAIDARGNAFDHVMERAEGIGRDGKERMIVARDCERFLCERFLCDTVAGSERVVGG